MTYIPNSGEMRSTQPAAGTEGKTGISIKTLFREAIIAGYDWLLQAISTVEKNPIDTRDLGDKIAAANVPAVPGNYYYFDMAHYKHISIQLYFYAALGVGVKIEVSNQDDGTAPASCTYIDVTNAWFGAASFNADTILEKDTPATLKWLRLKLDNTGGAATEDVDIFVRRAY